MTQFKHLPHYLQERREKSQNPKSEGCTFLPQERVIEHKTTINQTLQRPFRGQFFCSNLEHGFASNTPIRCLEQMLNTKKSPNQLQNKILEGLLVISGYVLAGATQQTNKQTKQNKI